MIKNIISVIFNLFNFRKPRFAQLRYTDVVIDDRAFFLITWQLEAGYKLKIKSLNYRSYKSSGSAYIAIPADVDHIELVTSNVWKYATKQITLVRQPILSQVDFFPVKQFEALAAAPQISLVLKTPRLRRPESNLQVPVFAIHTKNLTQP
jgi:hypothetical protein